MCLEGNLHAFSRCPGRDSNRVPHKYQSKALVRDNALSLSQLSQRERIRTPAKHRILRIGVMNCVIVQSLGKKLMQLQIES
jgi:hypothetical protein